MFEVRNSQHLGSSLSKRDAWDDEFILKRHFSALIPAFDPRPGRTNVNQTSDIEIPPPSEDCLLTMRSTRSIEETMPIITASAEESAVASFATEIHQPPQIQLTLKGPNLPGMNTIGFFDAFIQLYMCVTRIVILI